MVLYEVVCWAWRKVERASTDSNWFDKAVWLWRFVDCQGGASCRGRRSSPQLPVIHTHTWRFQGAGPHPQSALLVVILLGDLFFVILLDPLELMRDGGADTSSIVVIVIILECLPLLVPLLMLLRRALVLSKNERRSNTLRLIASCLTNTPSNAWMLSTWVASEVWVSSSWVCSSVSADGDSNDEVPSAGSDGGAASDGGCAGWKGGSA